MQAVLYVICLCFIFLLLLSLVWHHVNTIGINIPDHIMPKQHCVILAAWIFVNVQMHCPLVIFWVLDLFIYTVFRWDLSLIDNLADYMKIALEIFFKTSNELIVEVLKDQGRDMIAYIQKNVVCTVNYEEHFVQNHQIHKTIKT